MISHTNNTYAFNKKNKKKKNLRKKEKPTQN